ncbi:MAG: DUF962 domain-containing protein [Gammaproteobacteria bacterium]|nr:DUF962 domain-containing protein [Gammaproteobacteria bacterium]
MRTIHQWLDEYDESHRNQTNKALHWICVPLIMLSLLGLLYPLSLPLEQNDFPFQINGASVLMILAIVYYLLISWPLAIGMMIVSILMFILLELLSGLSTPLWLISLIVFALAWIGQFIGHQIEGKKPSFFKDVQFLLIGPLWLLAFIYRKLHIRF